MGQSSAKQICWQGLILWLLRKIETIFGQMVIVDFTPWKRSGCTCRSQVHLTRGQL